MKDYTQRVEASPMDTPTVQPIYINSGGTATVIIVMFLFSVVILGLVYRDSSSAITGILASVPVFLVGTPVLVLAVRGDIARIVCDYQAEITTRLLHDHQFSVPDAAQLAQFTIARPSQLERSPDTEGVQDDNALPASTYVPAVANARQVAREATMWAYTLYTDEGQPDPARVSMKGGKEKAGRLKVAAPQMPDIKQFLLDKHVLEAVANGYRLNLETFDTRESLRWLGR